MMMDGTENLIHRDKPVRNSRAKKTQKQEEIINGDGNGIDTRTTERAALVSSKHRIICQVKNGWQRESWRHSWLRIIAWLYFNQN